MQQRALLHLEWQGCKEKIDLPNELKSQILSERKKAFALVKNKDPRDIILYLSLLPQKYFDKVFAEKSKEQEAPIAFQIASVKLFDQPGNSIPINSEEDIKTICTTRHYI